MLRDYARWKQEDRLMVHDVERKRHFFRPMTERELNNLPYIEKLKVREYDN